MAPAYTLTNARSHLGELVNRVRFGRERVILSEHGKPVAAIISVEELAELQAAADAADLAVVAAVREAREPGIPHAEVVAAMDAIDQAEGAGSSEEAANILAPYMDILFRAESDRTRIDSVR